MSESLTPKLETLIAELVDSGPYRSRREVIEEAVRVLYLRDHFAQLREDVRHGLEQLERGEAVPFDKRMLARIKREGRKRLEAERAPARSR